MFSRHSATSLRRPRRRDGFTLLDSVLACGILALALGAVFTVSSHALQTLRLAKDETVASQVLQQRLEQLRIANWQRVSDPTWIRDNILNVEADGAFGLNALKETVTITPYNSATAGSNVFTRQNYLAAAAAGNTDLLAERTVRILWALDWKGVPKNRPHRRESVIILAKGGVAK
jgi:type II secretory pathway pseudopilin PulG